MLTSMVTGNDEQQDALRSIALVNRLLEVEERVQGLAQENLKLKRELATAPTRGPGSGAFFERAPNGARVAPGRERLRQLLLEDLGLYDRRCDDEVVVAGRLGAEFLARFNLLGDEPDYHGAIAAINVMEQTLRAASPDRQKPDVSIVIPIYGQLAYTLNCIHSLIAHKSRYTAEIIIVDDASPDRSGEFLPQLHCIRYHRQKVNGGFIQSCNTGGRSRTAASWSC